MNTSEEIKKELSKFPQRKLFQYVSGLLGAGLYLSGVFIPQTGQWQEFDSDKILEEFNVTSEHYMDQPYLENNRLVVKSGEGGTTEVVAGYITFDTTGTVNIFDSEGCSSLTDNGATDYSVNFTEPLGNYIYSFITSEPVRIISASMESDKLRIIFDKNFSGIVKIIFFEQILTYS